MDVAMLQLKPLRTYRWGSDGADRAYVDRLVSLACDRGAEMSALADDVETRMCTSSNLVAHASCSGWLSELFFRRGGWCNIRNRWQTRQQDFQNEG